MKLWIGTINKVHFSFDPETTSVNTADTARRYCTLTPEQWRNEIKAAFSESESDMTRMLAVKLDEYLSARIRRYQSSDFRFEVEYETSDPEGYAWLPVKGYKTGIGQHVLNLSLRP